MFTFLTSASAPWGAETSLLQIVNGLSDLGRASRILTCSASVASFLSAESAGEVVELSLTHDARIPRLSTFRHGCLAFGERSPVVLFSPNLYPLVPYLLAARRPVILDLHDDFESLRSRAALGLWVRLAHGGIAISEFVRSQVPWKAACLVVPRPIAGPRVNVAVGAPNPREVAVVGRLVPEKRIELAIDAIARVPEARLHVFGAPFGGSEWYRDSLEERARLMAPGRVEFHGRQEPEAIYRGIGVLLVANAREASGRTVGEAMLAGRVALVPSEGGSSEFVRNGATGYVWEASAGSEGIARALQSIINEPNIESVAQLGRESILEDRSPASVASLYAAAVDKLSRKPAWRA